MMSREVLLLCLLLSPLPLAGQQPDPFAVAEELKERIEQLRATGSLRVADAVVPRRDLTLEVYERRGFLPLWTDPTTVRSLTRAIAATEEDGLDPEHYHRSLLATLPEAPGGDTPAARAAALDLLRTDAFVRLSHDLRFGKVAPDGPASEADTPWPFGGAEAVETLSALAISGDVETALEALRPRHFVYQGLRRALVALRRIQDSGGWERIPTGPTLRRDSVDARVPLLRGRLVTTGDLPEEARATAAGDLRFDPALEEAVRSFQHHHGLNEDGIVGAATLAALNVPAERRIDQVRVNLERARWIAHDLPDTLVVVNVAGARVYLLRGEEVALETRAIVGKGYTETPVFTAPMLYVDLNPTWTVPPGIVREVLDLVRKDPNYLSRQAIRVLDRSGREVDPAGIDFAQYSGPDFPYLFRQDPGALNPLGRIKLMFPNPHSVYLHDTPARELFSREERLFSHGCIRVEDPLALAEFVLGDPSRWNRATLQEAIDTGETMTLPLERPIDVFVLYWTASVDLHGELHFYTDAYGRDARVLAELDTRPGGTPSVRGR